MCHASHEVSFPAMSCRCRSIPLVCKEFHRILEAHPPNDKLYRMCGLPTKCHTGSTLRRIAGTVTTLDMFLNHYLPSEVSPEQQKAILELFQAAIACPNLRELWIIACPGCPGLARQVGRLTQIQHLSLEHWMFSGEMPSDLQQLANLPAARDDGEG